jgi:hypothetical protein
MEMQYSQLKINHLNNMPSTKAVGDGISVVCLTRTSRYCSKRRSWLVPLSSNNRSLYADDLSQRLGLNETRLKPELTFSVLLNALYGLQKRIVGAGLLTATQ